MLVLVLVRSKEDIEVVVYQPVYKPSRELVEGRLVPQ